MHTSVFTSEKYSSFLLLPTLYAAIFSVAGLRLGIKKMQTV